MSRKINFNDALFLMLKLIMILFILYVNAVKNKNDPRGAAAEIP